MEKRSGSINTAELIAYLDQVDAPESGVKTVMGYK
jgi:hypothetical protein